MASEKITAIVESVKTMTVLELKELVDTICEEFGVSAVAAAAAPAAAAAAPAEEEKTEFDVILKDVGGNKMQVIKAVKELTGVSLMEAKKLVETPEAKLKEQAPKAEAEDIQKKLEELGAPRNLIVTVKEPSIENTNIMMNHPKVRMLVATGGPGIVKAVMSTGKKAIGAGAGNPPVVVDETADIEKAAVDIVNGCSFDNNLPCIAEKEVIAVDQIADYLIFNMKNNGAYEIKDPAIIEQMVDMVTNDRKKPNVNFVGKSAQYILDKVGIKVGPEVKCIIMEAPKDHPFVQIELMMPILPIVRVANVDEAIEFAVEVEHGNRHTAMMHSRNVDKLTKMAKEIETTIFVKNGPSYAGIGVGGMGYTTFTIAGPTGEGLTSAKSFCRKRRCVLKDGLHIRMK